MHYVLHSLTNFHNFTPTKPLVPIHLLLIHFFLCSLYSIGKLLARRQFYVCLKKKFSVFFFFFYQCWPHLKTYSIFAVFLEEYWHQKAYSITAKNVH